MTSESALETLNDEFTEDTKRWPDAVDRFKSIGGIGLYPFELPSGPIHVDDDGQVTLQPGQNFTKKPPETWSEVRSWAVKNLTFALPRLDSGNPAVRRLAHDYVTAVLVDLPLWSTFFGVAIELPRDADSVQLSRLITQLSAPSDAPEFVTAPDVVKWLKAWGYEGSKGRSFVTRQSAAWGEPVEERRTKGGKQQKQWIYSRVYPILTTQFPGAEFPMP